MDPRTLLPAAPTAPPVAITHLALVALLALVGCGGNVAETVPTDAAADSAADTLIATETGVPDTAGDSATPVDSPTPDTFTPVDGPTPDVPPPDTGVPLSPECKTAGGVLCTEHRWVICPKGYEPIATGDGHLGCSGGGWCCVAAPPSTCSSSGKGNCVVGDCKGCWSKVTDPSLTCESGRSCCEDMCD